MPAPVKHTCPDIDKIIASIKSALRTCNTARKHFGKDHEAEDYFWDIASELDDIEGKLEYLRKANSALREWGEGLEKEISELSI